MVAWIMAAGGIGAAGVTAALGRRPSRFDVLQESLDARGEDIGRLENRVGSLEADRARLQREVSECHAERAADRARFTRELAELRARIDRGDSTP